MMEAPHSTLTALDRLGLTVDATDGQITVTGPTERITAAMATQIHALKPALLAELDARAHRTADLLAGIDGASDHRGLEEVIALTVNAFEAGKIGRHQAEEVALASVAKGKTIPPYVPPAPHIDDIAWPEQKKKDKCYACGQRNWWWDKDDNRKCGTCHPRPPSSSSKDYKPVFKGEADPLAADVTKLYGEAAQ